jgi:hypothetical protein
MKVRLDHSDMVTNLWSEFYLLDNPPLDIASWTTLGRFTQDCSDVPFIYVLSQLVRIFVPCLDDLHDYWSQVVFLSCHAFAPVPLSVNFISINLHAIKTLQVVAEPMKTKMVRVLTLQVRFGDEFAERVQRVREYYGISGATLLRLALTEYLKTAETNMK